MSFDTDSDSESDSGSDVPLEDIDDVDDFEVLEKDNLKISGDHDGSSFQNEQKHQFPTPSQNSSHQTFSSNSPPNISSNFPTAIQTSFGHISDLNTGFPAQMSVFPDQLPTLSANNFNSIDSGDDQSTLPDSLPTASKHEFNSDNTLPTSGISQGFGTLMSTIPDELPDELPDTLPTALPTASVINQGFNSDDTLPTSGISQGFGTLMSTIPDELPDELPDTLPTALPTASVIDQGFNSDDTLPTSGISQGFGYPMPTLPDALPDTLPTSGISQGFGTLMSTLPDELPDELPTAFPTASVIDQGFNSDDTLPTSGISQGFGYQMSTLPNELPTGSSIEQELDSVPKTGTFHGFESPHKSQFPTDSSFTQENSDLLNSNMDNGFKQSSSSSSSSSFDYQYSNPTITSPYSIPTPSSDENPSYNSLYEASIDNNISNPYSNDSIYLNSMNPTSAQNIYSTMTPPPEPVNFSREIDSSSNFINATITSNLYNSNFSFKSNPNNTTCSTSSSQYALNPTQSSSTFSTAITMNLTDSQSTLDEPLQEAKFISATQLVHGKGIVPISSAPIPSLLKIPVKTTVPRASHISKSYLEKTSLETLTGRKIDETVKKSQKTHIISIDFGTNGTTFCYAPVSNVNNYKLLGSSQKHPTVLIVQCNANGTIDATSNPICWGNAADRMTYAPNSNLGQIYFRFDRWKMLLASLDSDSDEPLATGVNFATKVVRVPFSIVTGLMLQLVARTALDAINTELKLQDSNVIVAKNISWVLTVPSLWSDVSKNYMRRAAIIGGLIRERSHKDDLIIAYEPECAAIYAKHYNTQNLSTVQDRIRPGTNIAIIDAGGGTIDIAVYRIVESGNLIQLEQLFETDGLEYGSTDIEKMFIKHIQDISADIGETLTDGQLHDMKSSFIYTKETLELQPIGKRSTTKIHIKTGNIFKNKSVLVERVSDAFLTNATGTIEPLFPNPIFSRNGHMVLGMSQDRFLGYYDETISYITHFLKTYFSEVVKDEIHTYLLVGGFARSEYLRISICKEIESINEFNLFTCNEPHLAVVIGALMFGSRQETHIQSRYTKYTWGMIGWVQYFPSIHGPASNYLGEKMTYRGGKAFVKGFQPLIPKKTKVSNSFLREFPVESTKDNEFQFQIFRWEGPGNVPRDLDDPQLRPAGNFTLFLPNLQGKNPQVRLKAKFAGAELFFEAVHTESNIIEALQFSQ